MQAIISYPKTPDAKVDHAPLQLLFCEKCHLVQLRHSVNQDRLYREYFYRSGTNEQMRKALQDVVQDAVKLVPLESGDIVVDIGANDGTLLGFYDKSITRMGFEPAENVSLNHKGLVWVQDYFSAKHYKSLVPVSRKKAKIITSCAMFYDLEDPKKFVKDIAEILAPDGVWINQLNYLGSMIERHAFDNISHEHVTYWTLETFSNCISKFGLEIFKIELNDVNGGSIRFYVRHTARATYTPLDVLQFYHYHELELRLDKLETHRQFFRRCFDNNRKIKSFLKGSWERGMKTCYGYGAGTRGLTILQACRLRHPHVLRMVDRNPEKVGRYYADTGIPIISEKQFRREQPDYLLILSPHFLGGTLEREREYLEKGGKFLVPLPNPRIISKDGWHEI